MPEISDPGAHQPGGAAVAARDRHRQRHLEGDIEFGIVDRGFQRSNGGGVRILDAGDDCAPIKHRHLHAVADAEIGNPSFAGELRGGNLALPRRVRQNRRAPECR